MTAEFTASAGEINRANETCASQLTLTGVAVEKGTKAVISVNFSVYGRRTFNNLRTNFAAEIP
jgi:hypothetical protein